MEPAQIPQSLTNSVIEPYLIPIPYPTAPEDGTCIICHQEYEHFDLMPNVDIDSPVRLSPCNHVFGMRCVRRWLRQNPTCPLCRTRITVPHSWTYAEHLAHHLDPPAPSQPPALASPNIHARALAVFFEVAEAAGLVRRADTVGVAAWTPEQMAAQIRAYDERRPNIFDWLRQVPYSVLARADPQSVDIALDIINSIDRGRDRGTFSVAHAESLERPTAQALAYEDDRLGVYDRLREDPGANMARRDPRSVSFWESISASDWDTLGVPSQAPRPAPASAIAAADPDPDPDLDSETEDDENIVIDVDPDYEEFRDRIAYRAFVNTDGSGSGNN